MLCFVHPVPKSKQGTQIGGSQLLRCDVAQDASFVEEHYLIGPVEGEVDIVHAENDRRAVLATDGVEFFHQTQLVAWVEVVGGLIEEQNLRLLR